MRVINILTIGLSILVFSCRQSNDKSGLTSITDTTQLIIVGEESDSIRLIRSLDKALQIGIKNIESENFSQTFETASDSTLITTKLTIGNLFDNGKYLIVRRETPNYYIDIYLKKDAKFEKVITHEQWAMTYVKDTIQDINGDGRKDFLVNWYGASGCCLKNFIDVYLQLSDGTFSKMFEFVNPTFSVNEQVIRGVTYGHPGQNELYKYKWNKLNVDTVEYIYHDREINGNFIKSKYLPNDKRNSQKENVRLKLVPDDYRSIYGFDWFMNFKTE
jgi:hypothetical protein